MYKTTRQDLYKNFAVTQAAELKKLQAEKENSGIGGFFHTSSTNPEPFKQISDGCLDFISMCELVEAFPEDKNVGAWKEVISNYANNYIIFMSQRNSFGIVPYGLFSKQDPGGDRKIGNYWYR